MNEKRVLVVRVGAMGDVLHALPAVTALRQRWPDAQIDWAVDTRWAPLLVDAGGRGPVVSRVHLAETRLWSQAPFSLGTARSVMSLRRALRDGDYDAVVDMQGTLRSAVIGRFARGSLYAGYNDPREPFARWFYRSAVQRRGTHVVEQGATLLGDALKLELIPAAPELPRDAQADRWAQALVGSFARRQRMALLAPTAGWGAKQWPAARFAALARTLAAKGWTVLVNASSAEDETSASVVEGSVGAATLVPSSLAQLIALLRRADLVVGGDSGPVHLAAALGVPLVALFGPTDPARNSPWGPGPKVVLRDARSLTSYKRVAHADPGLEQLSVDKVLQAVASLERL